MTFRALAFGLIGLALASPIPGRGDTPAPFPEFSAKRVTAPGARTANAPNVARKRITVQIDPAEQAAVLAARPTFPIEPLPTVDSNPDAPGRQASSGRYDWFWDAVSPDMSGSGPGRLAPALSVLSSSGKVAAPRLQAMQDIAKSQGIPILKSTVGTKVSPALVLAVIAVESSGRTDALSTAGAAGLMQLMPDTATRFGVKDRLAPDQSISGGVKYLDWLMGEFGSDPILVLAGYNAGEGAVKSHKGVPPYAETRDYVPKVLAAFQVASALCQTPPELISDGCVFVTMN